MTSICPSALTSAKSSGDHVVTVFLSASVSWKYFTQYGHLRILADDRNHPTHRHVSSFDLIVIRFHPRPIQPNRLPDGKVDLPLLAWRGTRPSHTSRRTGHRLGGWCQLGQKPRPPAGFAWSVRPRRGVETRERSCTRYLHCRFRRRW